METAVAIGSATQEATFGVDAFVRKERRLARRAARQSPTLRRNARVPGVDRPTVYETEAAQNDSAHLERECPCDGSARGHPVETILETCFSQDANTSDPGVDRNAAATFEDARRVPGALVAPACYVHELADVGAAIGLLEARAVAVAERSRGPRDRGARRVPAARRDALGLDAGRVSSIAPAATISQP